MEVRLPWVTTGEEDRTDDIRLRSSVLPPSAPPPATPPLSKERRLLDSGESKAVASEAREAEKDPRNSLSRSARLLRLEPKWPPVLVMRD